MVRVQAAPLLRVFLPSKRPNTTVVAELGAAVSPVCWITASPCTHDRSCYFACPLKIQRNKEDEINRFNQQFI